MSQRAKIYRIRTRGVIHIDPETGRAVETPPSPPKTGEPAKARQNRRRIEAMAERRRLRDSVEWH